MRQASYRIYGTGKGQTLTLVVTPEVLRSVRTQVALGHGSRAINSRRGSVNHLVESAVFWSGRAQ